jgi:TonB-linked SusC/RagA family outer membrane protein
MSKLYLSVKWPVVLLFVCLSGAVWAQNRTINGKVTSSDDGSALPGVNILEKGTTNGTVTDANGAYSITVGSNSALIFSFVGYLSQEVQAGTQSTLDIILQTDVATLSEIVVIGYGEVQKKDLTGAVTAIGTKDFNKSVLTSPQDLIVGRIAGVSVISDNGAPGAGSVIRIRGGASLNGNNDPLIVIDGVPVDATAPGGLANPLAAINPNDIETFTVLKDASSAAIYGSRASNGVIIITTKKGKEGRLQLGYNGTLSIGQNAKSLDVLDGDEYRALVNDFAVSGLSGVDAAAVAKLGTANTDWQKEIFRTAVSQDHMLSVSGSVKKFPYRVSYGFTDQQGTLKNTSVNRHSLNINLTPTFLNGDLKVTVSAKASIVDSEFSDAGAVGAAVTFDPTQPVRDGNETYGGYFSWLSKGVTQGNANPVAMLEQTSNNATAKRFIGNAQFEYRLPFFKDLTATLNLGLDDASSDGYNRAPMNAGFVHSTGVLTGRDNTYFGNNTNELLDFYLHYLKTVNNHKIDFTAGYSWQHFYRDAGGVNGSSIATTTYASKSENYLVSFFGRLNYTFKDKYLLTAVLRQDGSSRTKDHWGTFPAVTLGWQISEEAFMTGADVVSNLKLRAGWGITGQQDQPNVYYAYIARYRASDNEAQYQLGNTFYVTQRPEAYDANYRWEQTTTYNVGLDFGFLNDRISGSIDLFQKDTKDLLNYIQIPNGSNFSNYLDTNVGSMTNQGIEITLSGDVINSGDLKWNLGANFTSINSEITKLNLIDDPNSIGTSAGNIGVDAFIQNHQIGYPAFSYFVYQQVYDEAGRPVEGLYVDRVGDGTVVGNNRNKYRFHRPQADYLIGINSRVNYRKFDFSFSSRLSIGNYVYNRVESGNAFYNNVYQLQHFRNIPEYVSDTDFISSQQYSDYYVQDASFFKLDNVSLGYSFDQIVGQRLKARLNLTVQNALVVTDYKGIDPEHSSGIDNNIYPRPRTFLLGLNVTF